MAFPLQNGISVGSAGHIRAASRYGDFHNRSLTDRSQQRSIPMSSGEKENVSSKIFLTFSIVILTPVLLMVVFEKLQFPLIKGIGGF